MQQIVTKVGNRIDTRIRAATAEVFKNIIMMTPVDLGRLKQNWQCTIGEPFEGEISAPSDGEDYADNAVEKMQGVVPKKAGKVVYLTNNVPYVQRIEYEGHSKIKAPDGMVRVSLALFEGILNGTR